ncbi:MAG: AarF/ABC1/UbiB kinase family protein [Oceanospirillaceae bacterium]|nr:AarF/ABC1/UbiB kinase family protein [Oceanospirillaceae bacterium]
MSFLNPSKLGDKLSTSKLARTAITGIAASKIAATLALQSTKKRLINADISESQQRQNEREIGKLMFSALSQLRGTALKVSQILSMEADLLPEGIRLELAKSCYQVPPLNRAVIHRVFLKEFKNSPSIIFSRFESTAFAAASLGQVHKASDDTGEKLAVKIQYPGIASSIGSDMKMIRTLLLNLANHSALLPNKTVISDVLNEIEQRLEEEVDYILEAENTVWFKEHLSGHNIVIPSVYPQYSTEKVLTTQFLSGVHVDEWLLTNPTQTVRNDLGQRIYDVFIYSAFELGKLHADPHPGNYLFMDDGQLAILDFGCINIFGKESAQQKTQLLNAFLEADATQRAARVLSVYQGQNIIDSGLSLEEFTSQLLPLLEPLYEWISMPFEHGEYDFAKYPSCPKVSLSDAKKSNQYLASIPQNQMYFDRSLVGVFAMLKKMGAQIKTANRWIYVGG